MKTLDVDLVIEKVRFRCPFCDGIGSAVEADGRDATFHTVPPCDRFVALDPIAYLRAARLAGAKPLS